ncbi:32010_t:CDS:2, partial [Racocetra persica]
MLYINNKNKGKANNTQKCIHTDDGNTSDQEQEAQNGSHVWKYFDVLQDKIYAEYKICKRKRKCVKYKFHGSTSNLIYHLDSEYGITKDNNTGYSKDGNIKTFIEVARGKIAYKKQSDIEIVMITWMIDNYQPFYLFVSKGLDTAKTFKKCVTNLILFFNNSPKQTKNLKDAQLYIITILKISSEKYDKNDAEYLKQINLTNAEWSLLFDILVLLAPFYEATKMLSAPPEDEDDKYYVNLLNEKKTPSQDQLIEIYEDSNYEGTIIDKLNELYQIEQAIIIEESNNDLFVNLFESLATNKIVNTDQINYSLLRVFEDSDEDESNISDE